MLKMVEIYKFGPVLERIVVHQLISIGTVYQVFFCRYWDKYATNFPE